MPPGLCCLHSLIQPWIDPLREVRIRSVKDNIDKAQIQCGKDKNETMLDMTRHIEMTYANSDTYRDYTPRELGRRALAVDAQ